MDKIKISLITATYNSDKTLPDALNSVAQQSGVEVEYIVVDGGSKDGTISFIEQQNGAVSKWISEPDKGIYDALNKGIRMATGDVIGFVHSDDLLASKDILSKVADMFNDVSDVNDASDGNVVHGVYGDLHYVDAQNPDKIIRNWKSQPFKPSLLKRGWMPAHPTLFLRKEVYEKHGLFNLDYRIAADYDMMLRIFQDDTLNFKYLPEVITKMRVGGASNRSLKNIIQKSKEDYKALRANRISNPLYALAWKNLSKVSQFIAK